MAITLLFEPKAGADALHDSTIKALKEQGNWPPEGLTYHVAFGTGADFKVLEVWESEQLARSFGERLMPILKNHREEHHQGQVALSTLPNCAFESGLKSFLGNLSYGASQSRA
jgi:hypothetical protein